MSTPNDPIAPKRSAGLAAVAVALMVIGLLILVPSGLCTAIVGLAGIVSGLSTGQWGGLGLAIGFGIVPILLGGALVWAAVRLLRRK
jgi:hypothetical protein